MKLLSVLSLLFTVTLFFNRCGFGNSPEKTANRFMEHLANQNYEAAKTISTETTKKLLDLFKTVQSMGEKYKTEEDKQEKPVFDCSCEQDGEKANCKCCEKDNEKECTSFEVFKVEGKWLVDLKKGDNLGQ